MEIDLVLLVLVVVVTVVARVVSARYQVGVVIAVVSWGNISTVLISYHIL